MLSSSSKIVAEVKAHSRVRIPDICLSFKFTIFFQFEPQQKRIHSHALKHENKEVKKL